MRSRAHFLVIAPLVAAGCTSDLNAPSNYQLPEGSSGPGPMPVAIECGDVPTGAVDAAYSYTPTVMDGDGDYTFESPDLPEGLAIDAATGEVTGNPTTSGTFDFTINVADGSGGTGTQMCQVQVNERIGVDLDAALLVEMPFCLGASQSLTDFIIEGTGDGSPVTCDHQGGSGDGNLPAGITVNPDDCTLDGTLAEDRFGTYVFVMRGTQNGVSVYMPYCVTQDEASFAYDVSMTHSGIDPAALVPIGRTFDPGAMLHVGATGDPLFTIIDMASCGMNSCYFGYAFGINGSPFDADTFTLPNRTLEYDPADDTRPIGFSHELEIEGPPVPEEFRDRPWVVNISLDYCLADNPDDCDGAGATQANGDGHLEFGIIMVPE
jgi:hypothetical protein